MLAALDATQVSVLMAGVATLGGLIFAMIRWPTDRSGATVKLTADAMDVQVTLNDRLKLTVGDLVKDVSALKTEMGGIATALAAVTSERDQLSRENEGLKARVKQLEDRVERAEARQRAQTGRGDRADARADVAEDRADVAQLEAEMQHKRNDDTPDHA